MKRTILTICMFTMLVSGGCKNGAYVNHPGAINTFDSQTYDALVSAKAVIDQTKMDLAAQPPVFPANIAAGVKSALNGLITAYNVADTTYQAYHTAGASATAAQQAAVVSSQAQLSSSLSTLSAAKTGGTE